MHLVLVLTTITVGVSSTRQKTGVRGDVVKDPKPWDGRGVIRSCVRPGGRDPAEVTMMGVKVARRFHRAVTDCLIMTMESRRHDGEGAGR